jgi:glucan phosphoethanolaminetransferase (alkaline phosphatase superfamily)
MLLLFLILWLVFLALHILFRRAATKDKKLSNALNAFIIAPMSVLGYLIQPILIPKVQHPILLSLVLMASIIFFAFVNLKLARMIRNES